MARRAARPGGFDLDRAADLHEFDDALGAFADQRRPAAPEKLGEGRLGHGGPLGSPAGDEKPLRLQLAQGLSHGRAADAQPGGQVAFGRDAVAGLVLARGDESAELGGDLVADGLRRDGMKPDVGGVAFLGARALRFSS